MGTAARKALLTVRRPLFILHIGGKSTLIPVRLDSKNRHRNINKKYN